MTNATNKKLLLKKILKPFPEHANPKQGGVIKIMQRRDDPVLDLVNAHEGYQRDDANPLHHRHWYSVARLFSRRHLTPKSS